MYINTSSKRIFLGLLTSEAIPMPVTEHRFHPPRRWRFDYAWPEQAVALEVEGGAYGIGKRCPACGQRKGGAHRSVKDFLKDIEKYNQAVIDGWRVIRVPTDKLLTMDTIRALRALLERP